MGVEDGQVVGVEAGGVESECEGGGWGSEGLVEEEGGAFVED